MTPLALAIYEVLRVRVPDKRPELAYTQLIEHLPALYSNLEPDGEMLAGALGELVKGCRARGLPAISAMVVRYRERVPGPGYYPMAHPDVADDDAKKMIAWGNELELVRSEKYPATL